MPVRNKFSQNAAIDIHLFKYVYQGFTNIQYMFYVIPFGANFF